MINDRLKSWALGAEIIGGIAVVISLGVVAFEFNQSTQQTALNTNALEISAYQRLIESIIEINSLIAIDSEFARIEGTVKERPEELTEEELRRLNAFYMNIFRHGDLAYFQYERGAINDIQLGSALGILFGNLINNPIARRRWNQMVNSGSSNMSYVEHVERILSRNE